MPTLRAFEAAVRYHSYSAAARELGVTHGAISHRIRTLEEQLGARLFERRGREMVPTREAVALAAQVGEGLQILSLALPAGDVHGPSRLVVGAHHSFALAWLIPRLDGFLAAHPTIDVEIHSSAELGDFIKPKVDVAIRYGAGSWDRVASERINGDRLTPVCAPAYAESARLREPADLARCRLLRHSWHTWIPWFRAAGLSLDEPSTGLLLSDSGMLLEAALAGLGVALIGGVFARSALDQGRLVGPFGVSIADTHAYYLLWNAGTRLGPEARLFRDWLHAELGAAGA